MESLLKTTGVFALILILSRLKVPLALAVLTGAVCVGFMFGLPADQTCLAAAKGAVEPGTLTLASITLCVMVLSGVMQAAGQFERIVSLASAFFRRPAVTMAALPAMVGLLPMPGGALFSAPMVESAAAGKGTGAAKLSAINYWFRHIWEYWWPIYPGVLLALELTKSDFAVFAAFQMPLGIFMAAAGLLIFRGTHPDLHAAAPRPPRETRRRLLKATAPIWIIIAVTAPAMAAVRLLPEGFVGQALKKDIVRFVPITLGLLTALVWTSLASRIRAADLGKIFASRRVVTTVVLVISVMVFQSLLGAVRAPQKIAAELDSLHVPVLLAVAILPFIAGMVTGLAIGFVGTSFPIVLGLVSAMPGGGAMPAYVALAYTCGHMGQMLSPLHLCHVLSNKYFKATFPSVYRQILAPAVVTTVLAVGYFLAIRLLLA
jgi:hypothetical protein